MSASGSSRLKKDKKGPFYDGVLTQPIRADTSASTTAEAFKNNLHIPVEWVKKMQELLSFYKIEQPIRIDGLVSLSIWRSSMCQGFG